MNGPCAHPYIMNNPRIHPYICSSVYARYQSHSYHCTVHTTIIPHTQSMCVSIYIQAASCMWNMQWSCLILVHLPPRPYSFSFLTHSPTSLISLISLPQPSTSLTYSCVLSIHPLPHSFNSLFIHDTCSSTPSTLHNSENIQSTPCSFPLVPKPLSAPPPLLCIQTSGLPVG